MSEKVIKAKKGSIEDIIAMNSLYRPGPEKFIPDFIEGRKNVAKIKYLCPQLKPILEPTYGQIVYQEQVMQIVRDLAGYTWGRSDLIRRAMSKKHQEEIDAERHTFVYGNADTKKEEEDLVPGCIANGICESVAHKIWDDMIDFAKYAFNKSHATAYSVTSFWTAYLKYYYTAYYLANVINFTDKVSEIADDIDDAKDFGISVQAPDINNSNFNCDVKNGNIIVYGLSNILNVGTVTARAIIEEREANGTYTNIIEFIRRTNIDTGSLSALIKAGAFDSLNYTRSQISLDTIVMKDILSLLKKITDKEKAIASGLRVAEFVENYTSLDKLKERISDEGFSYQINTKKVPTKTSILKRVNNAKTAIEELEKELSEIEIDYIEDDLVKILEEEKEVLGIYITGHPTDGYVITTDPIMDVQPGEAYVSGIIKDFKVRKDRNGNDFSTFKLEDKTGDLNAICFSKSYIENKQNLFENAKVCVSGKVSEDAFRSTDDEIVYQINVEKAVPLKKNKVSYRIICDISDLKSNLNALEDVLSDEGDLLFWIDSTTGLAHKINKFVKPDICTNDVLQKIY